MNGPDILETQLDLHSFYSLDVLAPIIQRNQRDS